MLKLSMKKLGTPDSEPPSVEGSGGVSADGDTAVAFKFVLAPGVAGGCPFSWWALPWTWVTTVGG